MKPLIIRRVKSRLSRMALEPGGVTVAEGMKRANAALAAMREPSLAAIDGSLAELERRFGPAALQRDRERFADLSALSCKIIDLAMFATAEFAEAARSTLELADECAVRGAWDWPTVDVHIGALALLRSQGERLSAEQRRAIVDGLQRVMQRRFGGPDERERLG